MEPQIAHVAFLNLPVIDLYHDSISNQPIAIGRFWNRVQHRCSLNMHTMTYFHILIISGTIFQNRTFKINTDRAIDMMIKTRSEFCRNLRFLILKIF